MSPNERERFRAQSESLDAKLKRQMVDVPRQMQLRHDCNRAQEQLRVLQSVVQSGGTYEARKRVADPAGGPEKYVRIGGEEQSARRSELQRFISANCQ